MVSAGNKTRSSRLAGGVAAAALAFAMASACTTSSAPSLSPVSAASTASVRESECYRLDMAKHAWSDIAVTCQRAATNPDATTGDFAIAKFHVGRARNELKDYAESAAALDLALAMPGVQKELRRRILLSSGKARLGLRDFPAAIEALTEALVLGPDDPDATMQLGEAHLAIGRSDLATRDFDRVIALVAASNVQRSDMAATAENRLGAIAITSGGTGGLESAARHYEAARKWNADSLDAWLGSGAASIQLASLRKGAEAQVFYERAANAYRHAMRLAPAAVDAQTGMGTAMFGLGKPDEAVGYFARAVELAPASAPRRLDLARALRRAGRLADAERAYDQVNRLEASARSYFEASDVQIALGATDRARESLLSAQKLDPVFSGAFLGLGKLLFNQGPQHFPAARDQFHEAERLTRSGDTAMRAESLYYLSRIETEGGGKDARLAISYAEDAIALDPGPAPYRAQACLVRIRFLAKEDVRRASGAGPCTVSDDSADAHLLSGMYHLRVAHFAIGDDRKRNWENAYLAFSAGQRKVDAAPELERASLRERLAFGEGLALYCVGFADVGRQATSQAGTDVRAYFDTFHVARCETY